MQYQSSIFVYLIQQIEFEYNYIYNQIILTNSTYLPFDLFNSTMNYSNAFVSLNATSNIFGPFLRKNI